MRKMFSLINSLELVVKLFLSFLACTNLLQSLDCQSLGGGDSGMKT